MPDTLMLAFQRPSDETIEVLRMVETNGPHWRLDECEEWFREDPARAIKEQGELVRVWQYRMAVGEQIEFVSLTELGRLTLAAYDAEAAGDGGQVEAKGTARCPLCGDDHPHYTANHREDIPFRPEIDWAFESFEEAWVKVLAGPRVWSPNELDRHAGCFGYKDEEVEAKWQIFRVAWLLARGRRDVLPDRD